MEPFDYSGPLPRETECPFCGIPFAQPLKPILTMDSLPSGLFTRQCSACRKVSLWQGDKIIFPQIAPGFCSGFRTGYCFALLLGLDPIALERGCG